jgi:hypothetical protein
MVQKKNRTGWKVLYSLGAFLAGATAGYFFSKAEDRFSKFGEGIILQILRLIRNGGGGVEKENHFSRGRRNRDWDSEPDPVGEGGGYDFQGGQEDRI